MISWTIRLNVFNNVKYEPSRKRRPKSKSECFEIVLHLNPRTLPGSQLSSGTCKGIVINRNAFDFEWVKLFVFSSIKTKFCNFERAPPALTTWVSDVFCLFFAQQSRLTTASNLNITSNGPPNSIDNIPTARTKLRNQKHISSFTQTIMQDLMGSAKHRISFSIIQEWKATFQRKMSVRLTMWRFVYRPIHKHGPWAHWIAQENLMIVGSLVCRMP